MVPVGALGGLWGVLLMGHKWVCRPRTVDRTYCMSTTYVVVCPFRDRATHIYRHTRAQPTMLPSPHQEQERDNNEIIRAWRRAGELSHVRCVMSRLYSMSCFSCTVILPPSGERPHIIIYLHTRGARTPNTEAPPEPLGRRSKPHLATCTKAAAQTNARHHANDPPSAGGTTLRAERRTTRTAPLP